MGLLYKLFLLAIPVGIAYLYFKISETDPIPTLQDEYWGPQSKQAKKEDPSIRPFEIKVSEETLTDLKSRLKQELTPNRLPPQLEGVGFEYGFNSKYLQSAGQYWLEKYDWKQRETLLNKYSQFKTKIGGLDIHFYHVKPKEKQGVKTRPVLLLHGWPGSVVEYQKIIPLLLEPQNSKFNYELVIPSLPGFGFSDSASRPGFGTPQMANIFKRLMERLGHTQFFVMGEDCSAMIASDIATLYPDRVLGVHSINCVDLSVAGHLKHLISSTFPSFFATPEMAERIIPWVEQFKYDVRESGYVHIQATKPDTVGVGLTHSPLGLAAYILEKFSTWTNRTWISREDGGLTENFTLDELLDNVMVYWITGSITTSQRLYAEMLSTSRQPNLDRVPTNVPFDCFFMPGFVMTEFAIRSKYTNVKRISVSPRGGHFGAFEVPKLLAQDALLFFNSL